MENSAALTDAQKEVRLKEIELEQLRANLTALGQLPLPENKPAEAPRIPHVIRSGESLERLAAVYGLSVEDLMTLNSGRDIRDLRPGDTINLPANPGPRTLPPTGR